MLGNTSEQLNFTTRKSGVLRVTQRALRGDAPWICMDFPINVPNAADVPASARAGSALVSATVGSLPVTDVVYAPSLRSLTIVLEGGGADGLQRLRSVKPDTRAMVAAYPDFLFVNVTVKGAVGVVG